MTKDTLSQRTMLFDLQRDHACQLLPRQISPTEGQQSHQLSQPLSVRHVRRFQTKTSGLQATEQSFNSPSARIISKQQSGFLRADDNHILAITAPQDHHKQPLPQDLARPREQDGDACLLCTEQIPGRYPLRVARVLHQQILFQSQAKPNALSTQKGQPIHSDKLSVRANKLNTLPPEQAQVLFDQVNALIGVGAAFLLKNRPQQREADASISDAQQQDIQRRLAQVPIGAVNRDDKRRPESHQLNDETSQFSERQLEESQEALNPLVMRCLFGSPAHHTGDLGEVDGLDLNHSYEELGQEVDSSFVPRYILSKRSLQQRLVDHCASSFTDLFGDRSGEG